MKNTMRKSSVFAATILAALLIGCDNHVTNQDIKDQEQAVAKEQQKLEALKKRQQVEEQMDSRLADMKKKINDLEEQAKKAEGEQEVRLQGEIAELKTQYDQAEEQMRQLRAASGDKWAQVQLQTDKAWNDLSDSINKKLKEWNKKDGDDSSKEKATKDSDAGAKPDAGAPPTPDKSGGGSHTK